MITVKNSVWTFLQKETLFFQLWRSNLAPSISFVQGCSVTMALFTHWKLQRISLWNWVWHNLFNFWKLANPIHDYRFCLGFLSFLGSIWAIYISQGKKIILSGFQILPEVLNTSSSIFLTLSLSAFPSLISKFAYLCFLPFSLNN